MRKIVYGALVATVTLFVGGGVVLAPGTGLFASAQARQTPPPIQPLDPLDPNFGAQTSSAQSEPPEPFIEWHKRQNAESRLTAYGELLLGDAIDPHTGSIVFEHVDVSIPGNSHLEVALRRRRSQGPLYHETVDVEFGDWELVVPRMKVVTSEDNPWTGSRCTQSFAASFPPIFSVYGLYLCSGLFQRA